MYWAIDHNVAGLQSKVGDLVSDRSMIRDEVLTTMRERACLNGGGRPSELSIVREPAVLRSCSVTRQHHQAGKLKPGSAAGCIPSGGV